MEMTRGARLHRCIPITILTLSSAASSMSDYTIFRRIDWSVLLRVFFLLSRTQPALEQARRAALVTMAM